MDNLEFLLYFLELIDGSGRVFFAPGPPAEMILTAVALGSLASHLKWGFILFFQKFSQADGIAFSQDIYVRLSTDKMTRLASRRAK
jgi:hypothetical protein